ncbi:MAG: hypothetical protein ABI601_12395 [bacterium]
MDLKRHQGVVVIVAGVAAAIVVIIGTGYRVTNMPGSPIGDYTYYVSIGVLVGVAIEGAKRFSAGSGRTSPTRGRAASAIDVDHPLDATPERPLLPGDGDESV